MNDLTCNHKKVVIPSYAKINLTLDVGDLRPDGYHEISSVLQTVSLADTLILTRLPKGIAVSCSSPGVPDGRENLAYRALAEIEHLLPGGIQVEISKRVPSAAGLGGGSSNAAAALTGANMLYNFPLTDEQLLTAAAQVGSDVPFFILGGTAHISGRGEKVTPVPQLPRFWVVLVKPTFDVSTAEIYGLYQKKGDNLYTPRILRALEKGDLEGILSSLGNDLEEVTVGLHPEIAALKEQLLELGALVAVMAGSGPTVYGVFAGHKEAFQAGMKLQEAAGVDVFVCRTLSAGEVSKEERNG